MTFTPVVPFSGLTGWTFLNRTNDAQRAAFAESSATKRDTAYFLENMPNVQSSQDLVDDRRLLTVALGAFGLNDDLDSKFFVKRLLDDGVVEPRSLANALSDSRYREFVGAFTGTDRILDPAGFAQTISERYLAQSFEQAVGEQNNDFRLAMNLERSFGELGARDVSNNTKWFSILGNPPLRTVFETAFRLPSSVGAVPLDDQLSIFKERAESVFGTSDVAQLATVESQEEIVRSFLLQSQLSGGSSLSSGQTALTLLQQIAPLS
jgi:hypothetical protein